MAHVPNLESFLAKNSLKSFDVIMDYNGAYDRLHNNDPSSLASTMQIVKQNLITKLELETLKIFGPLQQYSQAGTEGRPRRVNGEEFHNSKPFSH